MGKKKHRDRKAKREEKFLASMEEDPPNSHKQRDVKGRTKLNKRLRKKLMREEREEQRTKEVKKRCGFHMVTVSVKDDLKMDKVFLLTSIGNYVDVPFCPLGYFKGSDSITFYFDGTNDIAEAIQALNKRIPSPSGELMGIKVTFVEETDLILNCDQVEILKAVIANRFTAESGLLDLSAFHCDQNFVESNTFAPLANERILRQVLITIRDHMPTVSALNLSNNKLGITGIKLFDSLNLRCPSLSALNLENNNLKHMHFIRYLQSLPLKELRLVGNSFNDEFKSTSKYVKYVRKAMPFLKVLDGQDLTIIKIEPDEQVQRPSTLGEHPSPLASRLPGQTTSATTSPIDEAKLKTFLEQYYVLLDSGGKENLSQAYIPTAKIQLKSANSLVPTSAFDGQPQILEFLRSWPDTKHDLASFNLEILSLLPAEGVTKVSGVCQFQEADVSLQFRRTMKIIPFNSGLCCAEDLLEIL